MLSINAFRHHVDAPPTYDIKLRRYSDSTCIQGYCQPQVSGWPHASIVGSGGSVTRLPVWAEMTTASVNSM